MSKLQGGKGSDAQSDSEADLPGISPTLNGALLRLREPSQAYAGLQEIERMAEAARRESDAAGLEDMDKHAVPALDLFIGDRKVHPSDRISALDTVKAIGTPAAEAALRKIVAGGHAIDTEIADFSVTACHRLKDLLLARHDPRSKGIFERIRESESRLPVETESYRITRQYQWEQRGTEDYIGPVIVLECPKGRVIFGLGYDDRTLDVRFIQGKYERPPDEAQVALGMPAGEFLFAHYLRTMRPVILGEDNELFFPIIYRGDRGEGDRQEDKVLPKIVRNHFCRQNGILSLDRRRTREAFGLE